MEPVLADWNRDFGGRRDAAVRPSTLFEIYIICQSGERKDAAEEDGFGGDG